jgi:hypothetical protein
MKKKSPYWIVTGLMAAFMLLASIPDLLQAPQASAIFGHLGYPTYLLTFLGTAKILGVITVLIPGFRRLKEWAYAGLIFDLVGAQYSHVSVADPPSAWMFPVIGLLLVSGSYHFHRKAPTDLVRPRQPADSRLAKSACRRVVAVGATPTDQQPDSYRMRLARPDEISRLREIEDEAGTIFSGLGLIDEALDVAFPVDDLVRLVGMGQVWVGCPENDLPVVMVIASVGGGGVRRGDGRPAKPWQARARGSPARLCLRVGAGGGPRGGHAFDLPRRAVERAVLQEARIQSPAVRRVDARHVGDPREGGAARSACRGAGVHASRAGRGGVRVPIGLAGRAPHVTRLLLCEDDPVAVIQTGRLAEVIANTNHIMTKSAPSARNCSSWKIGCTNSIALK